MLKNESKYDLVIIDCVSKIKVAQYNVHRDLWSSKSMYFEAFFNRWCNDKQELSLNLSVDQYKYFEHMVMFIYNNDVPCTLCIGDWFGLLALADHFQVQSLVDYGVRVLNSKTMSFSVDDIKLFYSSSTLQNITSLGEVCKKALMMCFSNVNWIYLRDKKDFLSLPFEAVKTLLRDKCITVAHENYVLLLLNEWVCNGHGRNATLDELKQLSHVVRLIHLSSSFINCVLPRMEWFPITAEELNALNNEFFIQQFTRTKRFDCLNSVQSPTRTKLPLSWCLPSRSKTCYKNTVFFLKFTSESLSSWLNSTNENDKIEIRSGTFPWRGIWWQVILSLDRYGYLFVVMKCSTKVSEIKLIPIDTMIAGNVKQLKSGLHVVFCYRSFTENCINCATLTCNGPMTQKYLHDNSMDDYFHFTLKSFT